MKNCLTKQAYLSWHEAMRVARRRMRRGCKFKLRTYRCRDCGNWHLTSWKLTGKRRPS